MARLDLGPLFKPRSVALVGASDRNPWCGLVLRGLEETGFAGPVYLVNKSGNSALGRDTVTSCAAIGEPVDAAFIAVPAGALDEALDDLVAGGIRHGVVVTSGFAELGEAGAAEQDRIFSRAHALGLTLLGPNSLGVINCVDHVALSPIPVPQPLLPGGRIGLISQSGATTSALLDYAARQGIGFSYSVAVGNEASVDTAQIIDFLIADDATRAIAIYAEAVRDGPSFIAACDRALVAAKPIVMLKVGAGELAAKVAQAHTGALVGDDKVFNAICRGHGVVRVHSLEQLILTSDLLAYTGVMDPRPIAALSMSGGACGMVADLAEKADVPFAQLAPITLEKLDTILPAYGTANNPLDITGAGMADATIFSRSIDALAADDAVGMIIAIQEAPYHERNLSKVSSRSTEEIAAGLGRADKATILLGQMSRESTEYSREYASKLGIPFISSSMAEIIPSIGAGRVWSDRVRQRRAEGAALPSVAQVADRPIGERQTLDYLESRGVPVIPARIATSADEAGKAAEAIGGPVALKILSPDIAHKTEIGGVILDVNGADGATAAYQRIMTAVTTAKPEAHIDGVLVSPMRRRDAELFVGIARDPMWGLALALGLGGVWVELLADVSLRVLPVSAADVLEMLSELKGAKLLEGYRGAPPVNRAALAEIVATIGDAALALGPDLVSLEINPLSSGPAGIEALDALTVWA